MKETRMPPVQSANLVANSANTIYGVGVIKTAGHYTFLNDSLKPDCDDLIPCINWVTSLDHILNYSFAFISLHGTFFPAVPSYARIR